jgi:hypothetical protein
LTGHGTWAGQDFSAIGKAILSNLDWKNAPIGVHNAGLSAQYNVAPKRLVLSQIEGRALGGSVAGDGEVTNWLDLQPSSKNAKGKKSDPQIGIVHLRFKDLSAAEIAAALSTPSRPFQRIKPAGLASGTVEATWKDAIRNTEARFVGDVVPPTHSANAQYPLTAHAQGIYRPDPGELELAELHTRHPDSSFRHTFDQRGAQTLGHDHRSWRMAAGIHRGGICRADPGCAKRPRIV